MPQPPPKKTQTTLKNYNHYRSVRTDPLIWLKITADIGKNIKVEVEVK